MNAIYGKNNPSVWKITFKDGYSEDIDYLDCENVYLLKNNQFLIDLKSMLFSREVLSRLTQGVKITSLVRTQIVRSAEDGKDCTFTDNFKAKFIGIEDRYSSTLGGIYTITFKCIQN